MESASTSVIRQVVVFVAAALTPTLSSAQIAGPGDLDPSGRVYTEIVARVGEPGTYSPLIGGLTVYVVSEDGRRVTLRTNKGGTAGTWLARARYRIVTPEPYQFEGRLYTWDTIAVVRPGMALIRLQLSSAKSRPVPVVAWRRTDGAFGDSIKDGRVFRTLARDGVAISASVMRDDDMVWADVSISNGSIHRVEVEPQTITLEQLAPRRGMLGYRAPKGQNLNRALTANTLLAGQKTAGAVFFERDKKAREVVLRIPLSGVTFEVPFTLR